MIWLLSSVDEAEVERPDVGSWFEEFSVKDDAEELLLVYVSGEEETVDAKVL